MDPFPTKGIEYLLMIGYLLLLVPFGLLLRWMAREPSTAKEAATALPSTAPGKWFHLPEGFHLHRGHTWAFPEGGLEGGNVFRVGMDDFAQRLIGEPAAMMLPSLGQRIEQGERGWQLRVNGDVVDLLSPVEGEVVEVNEKAIHTPSLVCKDPYGQGWLMKVRVERKSTALKNLMPNRLAHAWIDEAGEQLGALMGGELGPVMQDGGVPVSGFARQLAGDRWPELAKRFLLTS